MNYNLPSKVDYQTAQETIKKFEKREAEIKHLNNILSSLLKGFQLTQFKVNKKAKEVIFSGVVNDKLVIGQSKCEEKDVFEAVIGKVIAVKRALKQDTKGIEKFVESLPETKYSFLRAWDEGNTQVVGSLKNAIYANSSTQR
jgi:hypothetical protein